MPLQKSGEKGRSVLPVAFAGVPALVAAVFSGEIWIVGAALAGMLAGAAIAVRHGDWAERARNRAAGEMADLRIRYFRSPSILFSLDATGRLDEVSDFWCEALGCRRDEVLGSAFLDFVVPEDRLRIEQQLLGELAERGYTDALRAALLRCDGGRIEILVSAIAQYGEDGALRRSLAAATDIGSLLDQRLAEIRAERLDAVRRVSGGIAHDFNNLLTVIVGNLESLRPGLDGAAATRLDMAVEASLRGSARIRQLLAFAQRQPLSPRRIDPDVVVGETASMLRRTLDKAIRLDLDLAAGGWIVAVDPGQLEAAVINLAINARDAMASGGTLTIATVAMPAEGAFPDRVRLTVRDTGAGIAPEILARVVEPFFTTKGLQQASGLGLSTVQGFAVQSGGSFHIDSAPGQGTRVDLFLPRSAGAPEPIKEISMPEDRSETKTILVVEDDVIVRFTVAQMLGDLGFEVVEAGNGREALELIEQGLKPDLLFTDVMMPGAVTVRALTAGAQAIWPDLRILYTSGYTEDVIVRDGILDEGIHLLSKPYRPADLAQKITSILA